MNKSNNPYDELKDLLLKKEQQQIEDLRKRLDDQESLSHEIGNILPRAVVISSDKDEQLKDSLVPAIEQGIKKSVEKNPEPLVEALFPMIGPAIRKSVAESFKGLIQSINTTLEKSFSFRGIKWRIESILTGKPYAEIILSHSLIYQVEQVFLIHKTTGLLLNQAVSETAISKDGDMVSAMLKAIQDFIHDSFSVQSSEELETIQVGGLNVWIEQSPDVILACVIRGNAPETLRHTFQSVLERIHLRYLDDLKKFDGDVSIFENTTDDLEACLMKKVKEKKKKFPIFSLIFFLLIFLLIGFWLYHRYAEEHKWNEYIRYLQEKPEILVVDEGKTGRQYQVMGLYDPYGENPQQILTKFEIDSSQVQMNWQIFQSSNPDLLLKRIRSLISIGDSAEFSIINDSLIIDKKISLVEYNKIKNISAGLNGISVLKIHSDLQSKIGRFYELQDGIEKSYFYFKINSTDLIPGQEEKIQKLIQNIQNLYNLAGDLNVDILISIRGHTDSTGSDNYNYQLSQKRANFFKDLLSNKVTYSSFVIQGFASMIDPVDVKIKQDKELQRRISFKVIILNSF